MKTLTLLFLLLSTTSFAQLTGYTAYGRLEQYFTDTGAATGNYKPNVSTDADYVAPVYNPGYCFNVNSTFSVTPTWITTADPYGGTMDFTIASDYTGYTFELSDGSFTSLGETSAYGDYVLHVTQSPNSTGTSRTVFIGIYDLDGGSLATLRIDQASQ